MTDYWRALVLPFLATNVLDMMIVVSFPISLIAINLLEGAALMNWYYVPSYTIYYFMMSKWSLEYWTFKRKSLFLDFLSSKVNAFK